MWTNYVSVKRNLLKKLGRPAPLSLKSPVNAKLRITDLYYEYMMEAACSKQRDNDHNNI